MKQVFPKEVIANSVDVHRFKHKVSSKIIFAVVLLSIIGVCAALPFICIDIYSSGQGILKSKEERNQITSLYTGKIEAIYILENQTVKKGDTLLKLNNTASIEKLNLIEKKLNQARPLIDDLKYLSSTNQPHHDSLQSSLYQKQYIQYMQKLHGLQRRYRKSYSDFKRQKVLYIKKIIAKLKYENSLYNLDLVASELSHYKKQQYNQWQIDFIDETNKFNELHSTFLQHKAEHANYTITAPISGTIQNFIGLKVGNYITASTFIAEISPDTELIAECYIQPADIGLLRTKTSVKLQVDAFNSNQWGAVSGKVVSIHNDVSFVNNVPIFKVTCSLDRDYLQLKNGFKGELRKGMTLRARFFLSNRSAFNLLYDKVDDWLNPTLIKNEEVWEK